jgi:hypothetical protein
MCLSYTGERVLDQDLTVYKIQHYGVAYPQDRYMYRSPFYGHVPDYGKLETIPLNKKLETVEVGYEIKQGVFHFYKSLEIAKKKARTLSHVNPYPFRIIKCTLVAGSIVYHGIGGEIGCNKAIFSDKVIVNYQEGEVCQTPEPDGCTETESNKEE